jgi:hypothetical protein
MIANPTAFIENAVIAAPQEGPVADLPPVNLDKLPDGVVSGTTLIDFSAATSPAVRSSVSLAMLFASRVATKAMTKDDDEDDWLAAYTSNLGELGFAVAGSAVVKSEFKKKGLKVHQAIIPFLTVAFGGGAVGPIILAGLKNLQDMQKDSPWITLFDRETRRFNARELHFAAVSSSETDTLIRYAIARLSVEVADTSIFFVKLSKVKASFESSTTTMNANNGLLSVIEPQLRTALAGHSSSFITAAKF